MDNCLDTVQENSYYVSQLAKYCKIQERLFKQPKNISSHEDLSPQENIISWSQSHNTAVFEPLFIHENEDEGEF